VRGRAQRQPRNLVCGLIMVFGLACFYACGGGSSGGSLPPPPTILPPNFTMAFAVADVALNGSTSLSFTLSNPNTGTSLSGIGFTDTMPAGLMVATPDGLNGNCNTGTITANAGSSSVSLSGATLAAGATCSFTVSVSAVAAGVQNNATTAVTSTEGGSGRTASASITVTNQSQQPAEPTDITPISLDVYYILNQKDGSQADLNNGSAMTGDHIVVQPRSFTSLSQRWQFTSLTSGLWQIANTSNGLCLDASGATYVVQNVCAAATTTTQQWKLTPASNGYYTISNNATGMLMDEGSACGAAGACVTQTSLSGSATQSQQWLLRPAFFRGVDNALLEKQEAARAAAGVPWWKDAGQQQDILQILKNHGVNLLRLRPSSVPPYVNVSQVGCSASISCYGETEAQDLDLAKRAKNLGLSLQLTLLFDGASSASVPSAWAADTPTQLQTDLYNYVKAEIMAYRQAGTMPDMVAVGNEVNNGFLGPAGSLSTNTFPQFALLQIQAMKAVQDAAADTSIGLAIPAPLTCIHITPDWDITDFFTLANQNNLVYDAVCQSYYPFYHGPLTAAQAAASNPNNQPIEQDVLTNAANSIGKPILILETGEHYENGFGSNDPWYTPPTQQSQNQFLLDLRGVMAALPNHLGMGIAYWDATGVNVPSLSGGFVNGNNLPDAIYGWSGLTVFDNADSSGTTNVNDPNYSTPLPALDALGKP
jgi:arabinogalactan endo-1,4-beta-galactosidase